MKCVGCGSILQDSDKTVEGFIDDFKNGEAKICKRCFRLKNYGEYNLIDKANSEFINILKDINKTNELVVYVMDIFNLNKDLNLISKYITNEVLVVLTKRDILPKSVKDDKVKAWLKDYNINCIDTIVISSSKNYNIDELYSKINRYKHSKKVYIVGNTNVGKSTLINKMSKNYGDKKHEITTSFFPSTTLGTIEISINDELLFIDTPGLLDETSITSGADFELLKKIIPQNEVKPITYQLKKESAIFIEDLARIDYLSDQQNSLTVYVSPRLEVIKMNLNTRETLRELKQHQFEVVGNEDIVINGLGWIKITNPGLINIYVKENVSVFKRRSII